MERWNGSHGGQYTGHSVRSSHGHQNPSPVEQHLHHRRSHGVGAGSKIDKGLDERWWGWWDDGVDWDLDCWVVITPGWVVERVGYCMVEGWWYIGWGWSLGLGERDGSCGDWWWSCGCSMGIVVVDHPCGCGGRDCLSQYYVPKRLLLNRLGCDRPGPQW